MDLKSEELMKTIRRLREDKELKAIINRSKRITEGIIFLSDVDLEEDLETQALYEHLNQMSDHEVNVLLGVFYFGCVYGDGEDLIGECLDIYSIFQRLIPGWPWIRGRALGMLMEKNCLGDCLERGFKGLSF